MLDMYIFRHAKTSDELFPFCIIMGLISSMSFVKDLIFEPYHMIDLIDQVQVIAYRILTTWAVSLGLGEDAVAGVENRTTAMSMCLRRLQNNVQLMKIMLYLPLKKARELRRKGRWSSSFGYLLIPFSHVQPRLARQVITNTNPFRSSREERKLRGKVEQEDHIFSGLRRYRGKMDCHWSWYGGWWQHERELHNCWTRNVRFSC